MAADGTTDGAAAGDRSWREFEEWRDPEVPAEDRASVRGNWILAGVWSALTLPSLWLLPRALANEPVLGWLLLALPASAVAVLAHAAFHTLRWRRHGAVTFEMDPHPGSLGGEVAGVVEHPGRFRPGDRYRAVLNCVSERLRGRKRGIQEDQHRSPVRADVTWQEEGYARAGPGDRGNTRIAVRFEIPRGLPESRREFDDDRRRDRWELYVEGEGRTGDFERRFDLPVFDTGGRTSETWAEVPLTPERGPEGVESLPEDQVVVRERGDEVTFHFPRARKRPLGLLRLLVGPVTVAGPTAVFAFTPLPLPPPVVAIGGGCFVLALGIALVGSGAWHLLNELHVSVSDRRFRLVRSLAGFTVSERELTASEVAELRVRAEDRGSGRGRRRRWELVVRAKGAGYVTVGDGLQGERVADRVCERMRAAVGMED